MPACVLRGDYELCSQAGKVVNCAWVARLPFAMLRHLPLSVPPLQDAVTYLVAAWCAQQVGRDV